MNAETEELSSAHGSLIPGKRVSDAAVAKGTDAAYSLYIHLGGHADATDDIASQAHATSN